MSNALKVIYTLWQRDLIRFTRDRARMLGSLGQPILFLLLFGAGFSPAMGELAEGDLNYTQFLFPGILAMTVLFTAVYSSVSIVWDREFGFLKEVMVAPVSRTAVALGKIAGGSSIALLQGFIILLLAPVIGLRLTALQTVSLVGLLLLLALMMTSLGLLLAARQRSMEGFHMIMNFVLLPMFFLSGAFFPLGGVPVWMHFLAILDPVTYGVDPLRGVVLRASLPATAVAEVTRYPVLVNVAVMLAFSLAFVVPGVWLFQRQE